MANIRIPLLIKIYKKNAYLPALSDRLTGIKQSLLLSFKSLSIFNLVFKHTRNRENIQVLLDFIDMIP